MKKLAIIYWSGTGNTEKMAYAVEAGVKEAGKDIEVEVFQVSDFSADKMSSYDAFLFGCPAMGAEVLEESEFEPFFAEAEKKLYGVKVGIFGSYDWGVGDWICDWQGRITDAGGIMVADGLKINNTPDDNGISLCKELGRTMAEKM